MKENPKVGQTLYSLNVGNAARNTKQELTPVLVMRVGRKYFWCSKYPNHLGINHLGTKYRLDDWTEVSDYQSTSEIYFSEQEYNDYKERVLIHKSLSDFFRRSTEVPLETLREIKRLLGDHIKNKE